jgi:KaiC/GvpD/RAD55 family RecA-like ATPase
MLQQRHNIATINHGEPGVKKKMNGGNKERKQGISDIFECRPAREWLRGAKKLPRAPLVGELWAEGEIAVMFGRTGAGKSIFAVQLAEAIARGRAVEPFQNLSGQNNVVYVDLERPAAQFIKRYSAEMDPETYRTAGPSYKFALNLIRVEPKNEARMEPDKLARLIEATGAKVLIIDGLAYFFKYTIPREAAAVMLELRRLRKRFGISILVTMNATRSAARRPITPADLPCSAVITAAADTVFAIGRCVSRPNGRYIKQLKSGSRDTALDAGHVPYFRLIQQNGNFPAFDFVNYTTEAAILASDGGAWEYNRLHEIRTLRDKGLTIRAIAAHLAMSRSAVHRLLSIAIKHVPNR